MFHESFVKNTGYAVSAGCCEALSADGRARTLRSLCRALAHQAPVADVLHTDIGASHCLRSVHTYLSLADDGEPVIRSREVRLQRDGSSPPNRWGVTRPGRECATSERLCMHRTPPSGKTEEESV